MHPKREQVSVFKQKVFLFCLNVFTYLPPWI